MYPYRNAYNGQRGIGLLFGAPFVGGLLGGFLGGTLAYSRPRPYPPFPPYNQPYPFYPPYPQYPPYGGPGYGTPFY